MNVENRLTREDKKHLTRWMKRDGMTLKLMYRASRDGCSADAFHQLCNGRGATISVGYTMDDYVFGGYASVSFDSSGKWTPDPKAFLFRLRKAGHADHMEYPAVNAAICCDPSYGPAFGNSDRCELSFFNGGPHAKGNDRFKLKKELVIDGDAKRAFNAQNQTAADMAGASDQFRDIEVYQVTDAYLLDQEWRRGPIDWNAQELERLKQEVSKYKPPGWLKEHARLANILLVGQVSAGKSSFCNTISSVFRGHVTVKAEAGSSEHSLTTTFRKYEFSRRIGGRRMKFRLFDTPGLEEGHKLDHIPLLLDGNVEDGLALNLEAPVTPGTLGYKADPKLEDKAHVAVFVVDGSNVNVMSQVMIEKMKMVRKNVIQRKMRMMILLTKVDVSDPLVADNLKDVYRSATVCDTVEELSRKIGVNRSCIIPVKNYERETELEAPVDILALAALRQMLRLADDHFEEQMQILNINLGVDSDTDEEFQPARTAEAASNSSEKDGNIDSGKQLKTSADKKNIL